MSQLKRQVCTVILNFSVIFAINFTLSYGQEKFPSYPGKMNPFQNTTLGMIGGYFGPYSNDQYYFGLAYFTQVDSNIVRGFDSTQSKNPPILLMIYTSMHEGTFMPLQHCALLYRSEWESLIKPLSNLKKLIIKGDIKKVKKIEVKPLYDYSGDDSRVLITVKIGVDKEGFQFVFGGLTFINLEKRSIIVERWCAINNDCNPVFPELNFYDYRFWKAYAPTLELRLDAPQIDRMISALRSSIKIEQSLISERKTGTLQCNVTPLEARVRLQQNGITMYEWKGMKIKKGILIGDYELGVTASGYVPTKKQISIVEGKTIAEDISLTKAPGGKHGGSGNNDDMVYVEGGTFQMGNNDHDNGEIPIHTVTLKSFYIDEYEITYEKWTAVYNWGLTHGYTDLAAGQNGNSPNDTNNPITEINWYDILKWCNARSEKDGLTPVYYTSNTLAIVYRTGVK